MRSLLPLISLLIVVSGCASSDWIDRTLVTADVTGVWEGSAPSPSGQTWVQLTLDQQGPRVTGSVRAWAGPRTGTLNGTIAGDVFTFTHTGDPRLTGELTVDGDEMIGQVSIPYNYNPARLTLRRVK